MTPWPTAMIFASISLSIQIADPESAKLQENQFGRKPTVYSGFSDHRNRKTIPGNRSAKSAAQGIRATALQRLQLRSPNSITN